jgi:hypothetical protein
MNHSIKVENWLKKENQATKNSAETESGSIETKNNINAKSFL